MRDQTLLYWGMVVTIFILIAGMLTARELIEMYFEKRRRNLETKTGQGPDAA
jgi:hypothetical protein